MPGKPVAFTVNANIEVRLEQLIRARRVQPMLLVFPDGRIDGRTASDSEWANTPSGNFESYITNVIGDVDHRYATLPCRQERAIAGLSAGAYGAANVGLHQDSMFGLIQVWSGYFLETHNGVFAHADRAVMAYNSPIDYVRTMRQNPEALPAADLHLRRARRPRQRADPWDGGGARTPWRPRVVGDLSRRPQLEHLDAARRPDADDGRPRLLAPARRRLAALHLNAARGLTADGALRHRRQGSLPTRGTHRRRSQLAATAGSTSCTDLACMRLSREEISSAARTAPAIANPAPNKSARS